MTDLLIIRNAETTSATGVIRSPDSALSDEGMRQCCLTADWINYNIPELNQYVGFTSPYLSCLQTASVISETTKVNMTVNTLLRDFRFDKRNIDLTGGTQIPNRSLTFQNMHWPIKEWGDLSHFYASEVVEKFIQRGQQFLYKLSQEKYDKVLVITHAPVAVLLTELAIGKDIKEIMSQCLLTEEFMKSSDKNKLNTQERYVYLSGIRHCGITYVKDGIPIWFSRVIYENNVSTVS